MEVILLEKVTGLGKLGDKIAVKPGYGRNYLIPKGKAVAATATNLAEFEARRAELEQAQQDNLARAQSAAARLQEVILTIPSKVGMEGKLFGSVTAIDIARELNKLGFDVIKQEVRLHTGPLRHIGEYPVEIHLHTDVNATVKVQVIAEE